MTRRRLGIAGVLFVLAVAVFFVTQPEKRSPQPTTTTTIAAVQIAITPVVSPPPDAPTRTTVEIGNAPPRGEICAGSRVTWFNDLPLAVILVAADGSFASGVIPPGGVYTFTFAAPGTYTVNVFLDRTLLQDIEVEVAQCAD